MNNKHKTVWVMTEKCNQKCLHCFSHPKTQNLSYEQHLKILENLTELGIKKIIWSGGECLLIPHLIELLKTSKEKGISNSVSTNGLLLTPQKFAQLQPVVDNIKMSLNSLDKQTNNAMISNCHPNYNNIVLNRIDMINNQNVDLYINILVSELNKNSLPELLQVLSTKKLSKIKLFEFSNSRGTAIKNNDMYSISHNEYNRICAELQRDFPRLPIECLTKQQMEKNYIRIAPDGTFEIIKNNKDIAFGNPLQKPITQETINEI